MLKLMIFIFGLIILSSLFKGHSDIDTITLDINEELKIVW